MSAIEFHRSLPGYTPSPLVDLPSQASELGLGAVWVKDECDRFGLPSFKYLGASWAVERLLVAAPRPVRRLVAATDGNHGRAVARVAAERGLEATVHVPASIAAARRRAIELEGAELRVAADYDHAVEAARVQGLEPGCVTVNDADPDGGSPEAGWVIEGYATLFAELDGQLPDPPDLLMLQIGVGAFAAAGVCWAAPRGVKVVGAEPEAAACLHASLSAGRPVSVPTPGTIMVGLDCGTPSQAAWPFLASGLRGVVLLADDQADHAARILAAGGVRSGESGAAGLAGLRALALAPEHAGVRTAVDWDSVASALVISTEGPTDPDRYARVVTESPT